MKYKLKIVLWLGILVIPLHLFSQIPLNDSNWQKDDDLSDEFNTFDNTFWRYNMPCTTHGKKERQYYDQQNTNIINGKLILNTEKLTTPECGDWYCYGNWLFDTCFDYRSGAIVSPSGAGPTGFMGFHYGYYEIRAMLPKGKGLWPAFWLNREEDCHEGVEIDIVEPNGCDSEYATSYTANVWWDSDDPDCIASNTEGDSERLTGFPDLSVGYHKYAIEWSPEYVFFYFDDALVKYHRSNLVPDHPMDLYFNLAVDYGACIPNGSGFNKPTFEIEYFRYYKLKMDNCGSEIINQSNVNFSSYIYNVKKSIRIYNTIVPTGNPISLRASENIEFPYSFEVPIGVTFNALTTKCY